MNFTDFKPEELIGKKVLVRGKRSKEFLSTIGKVAKTTFKLGTLDANGKVQHVGSDNYYLKDGQLRSGSMWEYGSCRLVTDEEIETWQKNQNEAVFRKSLENKVNDVIRNIRLTELTNEHLEQLLTILTPKENV